MAVPFVDLSRFDPGRDEAIRDAVLRVLGHRRFILGEEVSAFEDAISAALLDGAFAVATSSGTDALLLALMALGVGPGDRVLTTPFSFFATAGVIALRGATPVFLDLQPDGFSMDLSRLDEVDRGGLKAVVPVHLFGDVMDLEPLLAWAGDSVAIVEDAAQALGARDLGGRAAGTVGTMGASSFFPTKNLGAVGDAGMLVTRDDALAARLRRLRAHGLVGPYVHGEVGGNFRMDAIQAAALRASLPYLDALVAARRAAAKGYLDRFHERGLTGRLGVPDIHPRHTVHQFVVRVPNGRRADVQAGLMKRGIGFGIYYPVPFHLQPCFASLGGAPGDFPNAEQAAAEVLALPVFPGITQEEQDEVVQALVELL
jgi:dTDP-4-amino-4,6-dideoxygalactose transaminase